jgi:protein-glutamine gamma-glutamyltransferase
MAGQYDPQLLSLLWHFKPDPKENSNEAELHTGKLELSGKIVIRLQPVNGAHPPTYLREASYRKFQETSYAGRRQMAWEAGNTNNDYPEVYETPRDSGIWPLNGYSANRSVVNIACYLDGANPNDKYPDGLLPLPSDCNRLESLRAYFVYQNNIGAVLAEGPRLLIFEARFGSGDVMDVRPEVDTYVTNEDVLVPTNEMPALQQVISQLDLSGKSEDEKLSTINQFFANNFTYSLQQDAPTTDTPALARFLLQTRSGYCEYFATATVLLLRQLGIPARYVVGYYVHEAAGPGYVVRERDAHAWCLVWDEKKQVWKNFDTTPASWVAQEQDAGSAFQFLSDFQSWLKFQVLKFFEYGHSNIRDYLFWGLIPALAFLLYRIFRSSRRSKKDGDSSEPTDWPGLDSEFYQFERRMAQLGLPRQPGEPLSIWLQRATDDSSLAEFKEPLENILRLHYRHRFDPRGLTPAERQELRRQVETLLSAAFASKN